MFTYCKLKSHVLRFRDTILSGVFSLLKYKNNTSSIRFKSHKSLCKYSIVYANLQGECYIRVFNRFAFSKWIVLLFTAGFLDVKTAMRMIRNYNIVYRMGLDMASMELFIKVNSTKNRTYCTEASPTTAVINISLVINQLLQELGDNPDDIT